MSEAVIIGSGLGGLECGLLLARSGYRVTVLEKGRQAGGCLQTFVRGGRRFDTGFHYVGGLGPGESLEWLFKGFGLMDLPWKRLDFSEEVILDGESFRIPSGHRLFVETLSQRFPAEREGLQKYADTLKAVGDDIRNLTADHMELFGVSAGAWLRGIIADPLLQRVLLGAALRMPTDLETLPLYAYAQISNSFLESAWRLKGGAQLIVDRLSGQIRELGGQILTDRGVTAIRSGFVTCRNGQEFPADVIVSDLHPALTASLAEDARPVWRKRLAGLRNSKGIFTVNVKLKPGRIPYLNHSIILDGMLIHFYVPGEGSWAEALDLLYEADGPVADREAMAWACISKAASRLEGLEEAVDAYWTSTPDTWERFTGTPGGSAFGVLKDFHSPLTTLISPRTPLPGLYMTGQSLNLHGLLGVSMTALHTTAAILGLPRIQTLFAL